MQRIISLFCLVLLTGLSVAQTAGGDNQPPVATYNKIAQRNSTFTGSIEIKRFTEPGMPITGTNEHFQIEVMIKPDAGDPPPGPAWEDGIIDSASIKVGDEEKVLVTGSTFQVGTKTEVETGDLKGQGGLWNVRLSTAWWAPNSGLPITLKARFKLSNDRTNHSPNDPPQYIELERTVTPVVINRLGTLATRMNFSINPLWTAWHAAGGVGTPPPYLIFEENLNAAYPTMAGRTVGIALANFPRHEKIPADLETAQSQTKADHMSNVLNMGTVFFGTTHGEESGFYDSYGGVGVNTPNFMAWSWIGAQIGVNMVTRKVPDAYHLVVIFACKTGIRSDSGPPAFGIATDDSAVNRAFISFNFVLQTFDDSHSQTTGASVLDSFDSWVTRFLELIEAGYTAKAALETANEETPIINAEGDKQKPLLKGDPEARLYGLYLDGNPSDANSTKFIVAGAQ